MSEAVLLAACDAAPTDPLPRLILADCLEEIGTPGRTAVARLLRRSAKAMQTATPAAHGVVTRDKNRLSKTRPSAVAWFEWWFGHSAMDICQLHNALDRRGLSHFVTRCVRETTDSAGRSLADGLDEEGLGVLRLLERFAAGHDLTDADWQDVPGWTTPAERTGSAQSIGVDMLWYYVGTRERPLPGYAAAIADPQVPGRVARWAAFTTAHCCAIQLGNGSEAWERARVLHRRLLHECVPCPFDVEGDE